MSGLAAWILAQVDYDDRVAALAGRGSSAPWSAEQRRILAQCQEWLAGGHTDAGQVVLKLLAVPYATRPGYLEAWRP